jgi:hypothetical protein
VTARFNGGSYVDRLLIEKRLVEHVRAVGKEVTVFRLDPRAQQVGAGLPHDVAGRHSSVLHANHSPVQLRDYCGQFQGRRTAGTYQILTIAFPVNSGIARIGALPESAFCLARGHFRDSDAPTAVRR